MRRVLWALPGVALVASFLVATPGVPATAVVSGANGLIAYASDRDGDFEIYTIASDGSGRVQLTDDTSDDDDPAWSPDGSRIAFVKKGSCTTSCKAIWVMDADGTDQTAVTSWSNAIEDLAPVWISSTTLLFTSNRVTSGGLQPREIWSVPASGGTTTQLTETSAASSMPDGSPDGASVVFWSDRAGDPELYTMSSSGASQTVVALSGSEIPSTFAKDPTWSPDGTGFAFTGSSVLSTTPPDLYLADVDGSGSDVLYDPGDLAVYTPSWSPDGSKLVAAIDSVTNGMQLRVVDASTGSSSPLDSNAADERNPSWQPTTATSSPTTTTASPTPTTSSPTPSASTSSSPTASSEPSPTPSSSTSVTPSPTEPPPPPADAEHIDVGDFYFAPATPTIGRGATVTFDFVGDVTHTATDGSGLELYDSGNVAPEGPSFSFVYEAAGIYSFVCTPHAGMGGRVSVPMRAAPSSGRRHATFTLVWAAVSATGDQVYDVQIRRPGSAWTLWRRDLTARLGTFEPTKAGRFRFRARMRDVGLDASSRWSPASTIRVR